MKPDSPLRAEADSRFIDRDANIQTSLFDQDFSAPSSTAGGLNDYRQNYGLSEDPFSDDPGFPLFTGGGRRQLLDQLLHLCQFSNQLLVITGEQGVGKTRIAHALADSLEEQDQLCFLALSPGQSLEQILIAIAESFNLEISQSNVDTLFGEIENYIAENFSVDNEQDNEGLVLIIIDNAEHLDTQSISVLASLVENNAQHNSLHLVMVGEPLLVSRLNDLSSENLQISDFHLPALSLSETVDYLNFRMEMADYLGAEFFTDAMVDPWWRQARGHLRIIHELAQDKLLQSVIPETVKARSQFPIFHMIAISLVIAIAMVLYLYLDDSQPGEATLAVPSQSTPALSNSISSTSIATSTQVESSVVSSIALTTTQTPTQPLLPSLPDNNLVTNDVASSAKAESVTQVSAPTASAASSVRTQTPVLETKVIDNAIDSKVKNNSSATSSVDVTRLADPAPKDTSRFTAHEKIILAWSSSQFTIQLLGVSSLKAAQEFVSDQTNVSDLLIFKTKRAGKDWFVVVTGHYASNAQARSAINQLPAAQREAGPWPRQIKVIQDEIRK